MIQKENGVFYTDNNLCFYDCDCYKRAKLSTIMKFLAEAAGADYTARGYAHQTLWERGMVFLLSRTNISIDRMPENTETVTVTTWEHGIKAAQFIRAFELFDQQGEKIISAMTTWLLVDPSSRKILRPDAFDGKMTILADKPIDCDIPGKLRMPNEGKPMEKRTIRFSDLDSNGHVYNAVYGDIVCDLLPLEVLKKPIRGFQINYQTEATLGEEIELSLATDPEQKGAYYIEGKNAAGGNCFICKYIV